MNAKYVDKTGGTNVKKLTVYLLLIKSIDRHKETNGVFLVSAAPK